MDFLKSLDTIVDAAIDEKVDLVLFAGDAYKDRSPAPTFQREWGRRIMRLSKARIPTILLVGNHDLSPALGRAHALESFDTLDVPFVKVIERPTFLGPDDLFGLPLQILAVPWVSRSNLLTIEGMNLEEGEAANVELAERLTTLVNLWLDERRDPALPTVLAAHCSVQGASFGHERMVMLGGDLVLSGSLVKDRRLSYTALGHIHKPQNLNGDLQPPVIYPGSIERVDFGEAKDDKYFIVAHLEAGKDTRVDWRKLENVRSFIDCWVRLEDQEDVMAAIRAALPPAERLKDAIVRLTIEYPRHYETLIDDAGLREAMLECFEFSLIKRPQMENRIRLPNDESISSLSPVELLDRYWKASHTKDDDAQALSSLADSIIKQVLESQ
jgi:exonuclease SbcD